METFLGDFSLSLWATYNISWPKGEKNFSILRPALISHPCVAVTSANLFLSMLSVPVMVQYPCSYICRFCYCEGRQLDWYLSPKQASNCIGPKLLYKSGWQHPELSTIVLCLSFLLFKASARSQLPGPTLVPGVFTVYFIFTSHIITTADIITKTFKLYFYPVY